MKFSAFIPTSLLASLVLVPLACFDPNDGEQASDTTGSSDTTDTQTTATDSSDDSSCSAVGCPCDNPSDCDADLTCVGGECAPVSASCGDGNVDEGEECDDGNASNDDGCLATCVTASCGDGYVYVGVEDCDESGDTATCDADCSAAECGDGYHNAAANEDCDPGLETAACNINCTTASCGDGILNMTAGEICDAAGETNSCDGDCTPTECGDNWHNLVAEYCDYTTGPYDHGDCSMDCTQLICDSPGGAWWCDFNMTAGDGCESYKQDCACDVPC